MTRLLREKARMEPATRYRVNRPRVAHEIIDNEVVIIDFETGSYFSLEGSGADIWACIDGGAAMDEMVEFVASRYSVSRAHVETAVSQLIAELQQESLIVLDGTEPSGFSPAPAPESAADRPPMGLPALHKYTDMQDLLLLDPIHEVDEAGWPHTS
jgi:hypothetical protein